METKVIKYISLGPGFPQRQATLVGSFATEFSPLVLGLDGDNVLVLIQNESFLPVYLRATQADPKSFVCVHRFGIDWLSRISGGIIDTIYALRKSGRLK